MGGLRQVWGGSVKQHDALIRSLPGLTQRTVNSLSAIHSNLKQIAEQCENIGRRAAQDSSKEYPVASPEQSPAVVALNTIVETLKGSRHVMTPEEVSFYRSSIRSLLKLGDRNIVESAKLAKAIKDGRECLGKIERFYSMGEKGAARSTRRAASPKKPKPQR